MNASRPTHRSPVFWRRVRAWVLLGAVGAAGWVWLGCGKRGDPLPPLRPFPAGVAMIHVAQRGDRIHLEWNAPTRNTDGSLEVELEKVEILRRVIEIPPPPPVPTIPTLPPKVREEGVTPSATETAESSEPAEPPGEIETAKADSTEQEAPPVPETEPTPPTDLQDKEEAGEEKVLESVQATGEGPTKPTLPALLPMAQPPPAPPFPAGAKMIATLESGEAGGPLFYDDTWDPSWEGKRVEYAVRHINRKGRPSAFAYVARIDPHPPFEPPADLTAEVEEGLVRLQWSSEKEDTGAEVARTEDTGPEASESEIAEPNAAEPGRGEKKFSYAFNVYKKRSKETFYPRDPLNASPLEEPLFVDRRAVFGQPWCYTVRRVAVPVPAMPIAVEPISTEGAAEETPASPEPVSSPARPATAASAPATPAPPVPTPTQATPQQPTPPQPGLTTAPPTPPPPAVPVESGDSEEVCLTPRDTFAPPTPTDVFAVTASDGILISWREVHAPDLRGYLVYRAEQSTGPFDLLTPEPVRLGSFADRTVEAGIEYYYTVSAVDREEPGNESPRSSPVSARAPEP